jgi:hypothetical protein
MNRLELATQFAIGTCQPEPESSVAEPALARPWHLHALFPLAKRNPFVPSHCCEEGAWLR